MNIDKLIIATTSQPIENIPEDISVRPQKERNTEKRIIENVFELES